MKYSVFTACMPELTVEKAIDKLAEWGYDGVEWRVINQEPSEDGKPRFWRGNRCTITLDEVVDRAKDVARRCRAAGIKVASIASYLSCEQLKDVERVFEACVLMGAPQARIGAPGYDGSVNYRRLFDSAQRNWAKVEKLARKYGVRANVETHMGNIVPRASAAYRFVSNFDPAHVGVIYDPGNMVIEGFENHRMGLELLGEYLAQVHVKNMAWVKGKTDPNGLRLWETACEEIPDGQVNWTEVMKALHAVKYKGWLSLEDFSTRRSSARKLPDALRLLKKLEASS